MMGEDEHRDAERRVVSPPAVGIGIVFPGPCSTAEHPPAHYDCPGRAERFRDDRVICIGLPAAAEAVTLAKACEPEEPLVQPFAPLAQRLLEARLRSGDEAVQRHRYADLDLSHHSASAAAGTPSAWCTGAETCARISATPTAAA